MSSKNFTIKSIKKIEFGKSLRNIRTEYGKRTGTDVLLQEIEAMIASFVFYKVEHVYKTLYRGERNE